MRNRKAIVACTLGALAMVAVASAQSAAVVGIDASPAAQRPLQHPRPPKGPDTYGTTSISYINVDAAEMTSTDSTHTYGFEGFGFRYLNNLGGYGLEAAVHLPAGALITYIELDYLDGSATGQVLAALWVCDYSGFTCSSRALRALATRQPISPGMQSRSTTSRIAISCKRAIPPLTARQRSARSLLDTSFKSVRLRERRASPTCRRPTAPSSTSRLSLPPASPRAAAAGTTARTPL
jgi:hypothetical protein